MDPVRYQGSKNLRQALLQLNQIATEIVGELKKREMSLRLYLLILSILRVLRSAEAVLLLEEHHFLEEMAALTRTMAEVAINACYLQIAEEVEVNSFRQFDIQKTLKMAIMLEPFLDPSAIASPEDKQKLEAGAAKAKQLSQREDTQQSWSKKSVLERAKFLDESLGRDHFVILKASTWEYAHPYVHGTFGSFDAVNSWLRDGKFPNNKTRDERIYHSIAGANQTLLFLCAYVTEKFMTGELQYDLYSRITAAFELGNKD